MNEGVFSLWNGQRALKTEPARFRGMYALIRSTMSVAARICSTVSSGMRGMDAGLYRVGAEFQSPRRGKPDCPSIFLALRQMRTTGAHHRTQFGA